MCTSVQRSLSLDNYGTPILDVVGVNWVDINIEVGWTDTNVEVSWTATSGVVSELRSIEVLKDVSVLFLVDCSNFWNKVLIFFDFTGFVLKLFT